MVQLINFSFLRIVLFLGLVFRKVFWEVLRRREGVARPKGKGKGPLKLFKASINVFLAIQTLFLDLLPISGEPSFLIVTGTILFFLGLTITSMGRLGLGRNWANLEDYQVLPSQSVVTSGIYRYIRHPIYTGDILLFIGLELALNSWLVLGVFLALPFGIRQALTEESLLLKSFPEYGTYCSRTKRFIPFIL